jgi:ankyrin repeat protein
MRVRRLLPAALILPGFLLLAGLTAGLGSCRFVRPLQKTGPGALAPEIVKPGGIFEASARGDLARVRELTEKNPDLLDTTDAAGWDALSYAAWNAQQQVHEYLLQQGAEGNLFTEAALGPWQSFLQRLEINPIGVDSRDTGKKATPLLWAVRTGNQAGCEVLLSRGADILARDRDGNYAIHHAVLMGRLELIDSLLSAGADVDGTNNRGQTALHLSTAAGEFETARLLLDSGASLDFPDEAGNTPLHIAAGGGNLELCEYFLFLGAEASLENGQGRTPLDMAAEQGHERIVRLLEAQRR